SCIHPALLYLRGSLPETQLQRFRVGSCDFVNRSCSHSKTGATKSQELTQNARLALISRLDNDFLLDCFRFEFLDSLQHPAMPMAAPESQANSMNKLTGNDEWASLIAKIAEGDQEALTSLYDQSNRFIYGLLLRMMGDSATAEEVLLDVYLQVWRKAANYD